MVLLLKCLISFNAVCQFNIPLIKQNIPFIQEKKTLKEILEDKPICSFMDQIVHVNHISFIYLKQRTSSGFLKKSFPCFYRLLAIKKPPD